MYERETNPQSYQDPIWTKISPDSYENLISGQKTTSPPFIMDSRGGLLCEEMGSGKTLILISLILKTKGCWSALAPGSIPEKEKEPKDSLFDLCCDYIIENEIEYMNQDIPMLIKDSLYNEPYRTFRLYNYRSRKTRKGYEYKTLFSSKSTLIVVPPHLLKQWILEFEKFTNELKIHKIQTMEEILTSEEFLAFDVVLCSQTMFTKKEHILKSFYEIQWFRVVVDEGHILGQMTSNQTLALKELNCERRWICTVTPTPKSNIEKELSILHGLVKFVNHQPFSDKRIWDELIEHPFLDEDVKSSNLLKDLLKRIMIRTQKSDFDISIPSCEIKIVKLKMQPFEINRYNEQIVQLKTNIITSREEGVDYIFSTNNRKYATNVWNNLLKASFYMSGLDSEQRELCQQAIELELEKHDVEENNRKKLKQILPIVKDYKSYPLNNSIPYHYSTKLKYLLHRLKEVAPTEKCIVFTQYNEIAANILEALDKQEIKFVEYHQKYVRFQ
jgi:SNF2 family DNA or RNA helicase